MAPSPCVVPAAMDFVFRFCFQKQCKICEFLPTANKWWH